MTIKQKIIVKKKEMFCLVEDSTVSVARTASKTSRFCIDFHTKKSISSPQIGRL